jgi:anti-sigma regulatory factor (Ser/Thr protein kinase)
MAQPSSSPRAVLADPRQDVALCPARCTASPVLTEGPGRSDQAACATPAAVKAHAIGRGVVLEVAGRLADVVQDLDTAIQLALAEGPRGVVCDLTAVPEGAEPAAVELLATAGRHVRAWPGIPVAVACPDQQVRQSLAGHPLGAHLIVTDSMLPAVAAVLATPSTQVRCLRLAPLRTSPHVARHFVTPILLDWGLSQLVPAAALVVSELVTNSTMHAGTDIDLSLSRNVDALRVTVRDNSPRLPRRRATRLGEHGRGLTIVTGLSDAFGVRPTADGGKLVWAVLNATWQGAPTNPTSPRTCVPGPADRAHKRPPPPTTAHAGSLLEPPSGHFRPAATGYR